MKQHGLEIVKKIHELFKQKGITLSVAESCTGGLISHYLTNLPGASTFFKAGIIAYSEETKKDILGVSAETLKLHGMVSKETAQEMAEKVRLLTKSEYSISVTGNLGPNVIEDKEQGLIYIAVSKEGETLSQKLKLNEGREANKEQASLLALKLLVEFIEKNRHGEFNVK